MNNTALTKIAFLFFLLSSACNASDKGLFELFIQHSNYNNISEFLEEKSDNTDAQRKVTIKPVKESGEIFTGHVMLNDRIVESVSLWTSNERIAPKSARVVFSSLSKKFANIFGQGALVENIPNHEDASEVRMESYLWKDKEDIVVLMISEYPSRAGISITRENQDEWLERMGADSGKFWTTTLKSLDFTRQIEPNSNIHQNTSEESPETSNGDEAKKSDSDNTNITHNKNIQNQETKRYFPWVLVIIILFSFIVIAVIIANKKNK